nr:hypothetical protein [Tanacetum cinerariifolium]
MDQQNPTLAKIPILDTKKFEQWQFRIQQYLQHEHYALWEVIEFGDSYEVPVNAATTGTASDGTGKKKGRTITLTADDMQKRKNDNLLKHQYGNFKAEGSETLERTFNRLQVIVNQLQFMDVEIEQDDLNQKFLTSLAPEWLMHTIVWRNMSDLDTISLDDLYNHLKVYESEVQKKSEQNSQNMAFTSSAKHIMGNEEVNTASVSTASTNVPTASANIGVASISQDTACAYIASQSSGSQIKFEDINQIDEDDMEEMDIKWNMALLSMRADRFWKKTGKKISIQKIDVAGFDKSKVECFNCHKMGHFARECRAPRSQDRGRRDNYRQGSKVEEQAPKALMAIDGVDARLAELRNQELKYCEKIRILELKTESSTDCFENLKKELELIKNKKEGLDSKLAGFQTASKDLDSLLESQRLNKNKEGLGYSVVPPPAQIYSPPKKNMSWTGLPEPSPAIESTSDDAQNRNPSETSSSTISPKSFIKFVKANDSPTKSKTDKVETTKKPFVKDFKLLDDVNVLLRTLRQHNMYSIDLNNIVPHKDLTCLVAKASADEDDTITDYSRPSHTIKSNTDDTNRNSSVSETRESPSIITSKPAIKFVKAAERPTTYMIETAKKPAVKYDELYRKTTKSAIFTAVASLFFWQWQFSSLAVATFFTGSGNFITGSGNALCILFPTD